MAIPYFDAHCDTIWRCMVTEPVADYGETEAERCAYFQAGGSLRKTAVTLIWSGAGASPGAGSSSPCTTM